ncbi:MAG: cell division protein ZapA [Acidobacteria bacterium]|nr:cell division protein ZapA [Acidobacteriota bacterium]MCA1640808.1 cell division protein ZapA [Acidobacteriota bacterium]
MSQQTPADQQTSVVVRIFDQPYRLRTGRDAGYAERVATLVDGRMREVAAHMTTVDVAKIAVLTALNLADELESLKGDDRAAATAGAAQPPPARDEQPTGEPPTAERAATSERRSWFEEIFEADEPTGRGSERLGTQITARLHARRPATPAPRQTIKSDETPPAGDDETSVRR